MWFVNLSSGLLFQKTMFLICKHSQQINICHVHHLCLTHPYPSLRKQKHSSPKHFYQGRRFISWNIYVKRNGHNFYWGFAWFCVVLFCWELSEVGDLGFFLVSGFLGGLRFFRSALWIQHSVLLVGNFVFLLYNLPSSSLSFALLNYTHQNIVFRVVV